MIVKRATKHSAGYDISTPNDVELHPNEWVTIDTGFRLTDETTCSDFKQWFILIAPRSGLSNTYGLRIRNTVGIIDMDYRDTVKATVTVDRPYILKKGERFAQGIILPYGIFDNEDKPTDVRIGGFGSTGEI